MFDDVAEGRTGPTAAGVSARDEWIGGDENVRAWNQRRE